MFTFLLFFYIVHFIAISIRYRLLEFLHHTFSIDINLTPMQFALVKSETSVFFLRWNWKKRGVHCLSSSEATLNRTESFGTREFLLSLRLNQFDDLIWFYLVFFLFFQSLADFFFNISTGNCKKKIGIKTRNHRIWCYKIEIQLQYVCRRMDKIKTIDNVSYSWRHFG